MYAVIETGGKQYRVSEGQTLKVELLEGEPGATIDFDRVLMAGSGEDVKIGKPYLDGGKVSAEIVDHGRHKKIHVIKFHRRKHHKKQMGHRQHFTQVKISKINVG